MAPAAEKGCFTLTWEIKNFSVLVSRNDSQLESPAFKTIGSEGRAGRTILLYNLHSCIQFALSRKKENAKDSLILERFKVSILSLRGDMTVSEESYTISKNQILGINSESFLHDDNLTICCKIQQANMETGEKRIRTVLFKDNFFWNVKNFKYSPVYNDTLERENILFYLCVERNKSNIYTHTFQIEAKPNNGGCFSFVDINPSISVQFGRIVHSNSWFSRATRSWQMEIFLSSNSNFQLHMETIYAVHKEVCDIPSSPGCAGKGSTTKLVTGSSGKLNGDLLHLYRTALHSDATIQTEGRSFPVHKGILSIRSEFFRAMFEKDQMKEGRSVVVVYINDVDSETVDRMLVFLYGESLDDLQWEEAAALYYAADKYAVHTLKQKCAHVLKADMSMTNVCDVLVLADIHSDQDLMTCTVNFILDHKEVISSPDWEKLEESNSQLTSKVTKEILKKIWVN